MSNNRRYRVSSLLETLRWTEDRQVRGWKIENRSTISAKAEVLLMKTPTLIPSLDNTFDTDITGVSDMLTGMFYGRGPYSRRQVEHARVISLIWDEEFITVCCVAHLSLAGANAVSNRTVRIELNRNDESPCNTKFHPSGSGTLQKWVAVA